MTVFDGVALYLMIWWTAIFCTLPFGVRQPDQSEHVEGQMPGAPVRHGIKRKLLYTTLLAAVIWLVVFGLVKSDVISFRELAKAM
ncbi:MAG: DUF1467 family protein [Alphaproteobacteria bacterium]|nr:DUF1467 family protein [Alphaproteobacteria bacterium]